MVNHLNGLMSPLESPKARFWTTPLPNLHKRPFRINFIIHSPLCWRLSPLPLNQLWGRLQCRALQLDLDSLQQWSLKWQMRFNTDKCHLMNITHRRMTTGFNYRLGSIYLSTVDEYPYLGLTLTSKLSRKRHITIITTKANRMLGLIKPNLKPCQTKLKEQAFISLIRPHLEYWSTVWNPNQQSYINQVEAIQKRSARFIKNLYQTSADLPYRTESVSAMIKDLKWDSLHARRETALLIMLYKIANGLIAIDRSNFLAPIHEQYYHKKLPSK